MNEQYYGWQIINHVKPRIIKMKEVHANHPFGMFHYIPERGFELLSFLLDEIQWNRNKYGYITEIQRERVQRELKAYLFMLYEL